MFGQNRPQLVPSERLHCIQFNWWAKTNPTFYTMQVQFKLWTCGIHFLDVTQWHHLTILVMMDYSMTPIIFFIWFVLCRAQTGIARLFYSIIWFPWRCNNWLWLKLGSLLGLWERELHRAHTHVQLLGPGTGLGSASGRLS